MNTLPAATSRLSDVTVPFVYSVSRRWYVLRASYGREEQGALFLLNQGYYAYVARRFQREVKDDQPTLSLRSLIPNIVFAYLTPAEADMVVRQVDFLSYYYDHFTRNAKGNNPPLTIPHTDMQNFILTTASCSEHLLLLNPEDYRLKDPGLVRIIDGDYRGVCGRKIRAHSQQRVLVSLGGFANLATPYIPSAFLQKI